jgi:hypothetical protein
LASVKFCAWATLSAVERESWSIAGTEEAERRRKSGRSRLVTTASLRYPVLVVSSVKPGRHAGFILLAFLAFANGNEGFAGPCDTCVKIQGKLAEIRVQKEKLAGLLERNRLRLEELRKKGSLTPSIEIKFQSNLFMSTMEQEISENHEQALNALAAKLNCSKCSRAVK